MLIPIREVTLMNINEKGRQWAWTLLLRLKNGLKKILIAYTQSQEAYSTNILEAITPNNKTH